MGVGSSKSVKNFFEELKTTTSYRDFVIKMNQLIASKSISWSFSAEQIKVEELDLHDDLFRHFFVFSADFIYNAGLKKPATDKDSFRMLKIFLDILQRLFVFMAIRRPGWLSDNLWLRVNQDTVVEQLREEGGLLRGLRVEGKDFIASEDQLTVGLKILVALAELLFKDGFTIECGIEDRVKLTNFVLQNGWEKCGNRSPVVLNRISLLEMLLTFIMVEKKTGELQRRKNNVVVSFFKSSKVFEIFLKSLLKMGCDYKENGVLPYSAYFYKEHMEHKFYASALCLNLALIFLAEESEASRAEFKAREASPALFVLKTYLRNRQVFQESDLADIFVDEPFLKGVFESLSGNIISFYHSSKTILPNSFREAS